MMRISVIIPALNEEPTIAGVIRVVQAWARAHEIIVVSEGSSDLTVDVARSTGVIVLARDVSEGKAPAMLRGIRSAQGEVVMFLDGDLLRIDSAHLDSLMKLHEEHASGMIIGFKDRGWLMNHIARFVPISGQRVLLREDALLVPESLWRGYAAEITLNEVLRVHRKTTIVVPLVGLDFRKKINKVGLFAGLWQYVCMWISVFVGYWKVRRAMKRIYEA